MITIFSIPKPFIAHYDIIQRNAVQSWLKVCPECEIMLFGNERGVADIVKEYGIKHIPDINCNEYGTPFLDSIFERVQEEAQYKLICYVNSDIILLKELKDAISKIIRKFERFLVAGQRWDLDIVNSISYESNDWEDNLKEMIRTYGKLHDPVGSDYFIFPKGTLGKIPPFLIGRPGWDNWLIYRARTLGIPVIDGTGSIDIIHQNHDYTHVAKNIDGTYNGPEANYNLNLSGGKKRWFILADATFIFRDGKLTRAQDEMHIRQEIKRLTILNKNRWGFTKLTQIFYLFIFMLKPYLPEGLWPRMMNAFIIKRMGQYQ